MKIKIKLAASEENSTELTTLSDIGISVTDWDSYNEDAKREALQDYINNSPNQPYWVVDTFEES